MMLRARLPLFLGLILALGLFACSSQENLTEPVSSFDGEMQTFLTDIPTPEDEEFRDELAAGTFTICKVVEGGGSQTFDFTIEAVGPGVATAPVYLTDVTLGDGECEDVYVAPEGAGIDGDVVTIEEILPEGWQVDRIGIWSLDELPGGGYETTFHNMPAGTTKISGTIDALKSGCVAIFYNSEEKKEEGECTRTPGYWKTHPDEWPVESITIGGVEYSKQEAIDILWLPEAGDKSKTMFRAVVAAVLNDLSGTDMSCTGSNLADGDAWLASYPVCSGVRGNSAAWAAGESIATLLDDYNNGRLDCAEHCEDGDEEDEGETGLRGDDLSSD